jgi:hypothetical protein
MEQIERDLLYHFLPELKNHQSDSENFSKNATLHLGKLVQHLEEVYRSTMDQLKSLLEHRKMTWDLLWAFLKPGTLVFMNCPSTGLPRCIRYSYGEKKVIRGRDCFEINGHYFDFDGEVFGESTETLQIESFRGTRLIEALPVFPLSYHPDPQTYSRLISSGRRFISLIGSHHRQYRGNMFIPHKTQLMKLYVNGRIMVDAGFFRKTNPNYPRLEMKKSDFVDFFSSNSQESGAMDRVQNSDIAFGEMKDEDLARCSPTVLGFSLNEKIWG